MKTPKLTVKDSLTVGYLFAGAGKMISGVAIAIFMTGCSSLPTMKYCDKVEYKRDGSRITVTAECQAPVGGGIPGL